MLQTQAIEPRTLSVLKELMELPCLANSYLVGGTALALIYGHRMSIDLDLFGSGNFDRAEIETGLSSALGSRFLYESSHIKWAVFCYIDNIKVDIVQYKHSLISAPRIIDGIRMYGDRDLIAMKINAILGRGKKKDFWDIATLLEHYSISDCIEAYKEKFPAQNLLISISTALTYFVDAEDSEEPICLKAQTWPGIKKFIQKKVREYLQ